MSMASKGGRAMPIKDHIDILEEAVKEFSERYGEKCQYVESLKFAISILQVQENLDKLHQIWGRKNSLAEKSTP